MDISIKAEEGVFNYRVAAVVISSNKLLVSKGRANYYSLPGGRVKIGETAQAALERELCEELGALCKIIKPLWLAQNFFGESGNLHHEISLYYLAEVYGLPRCDFTRSDAGEAGKINDFYWLPFGEVKTANLYPRFVRDNIDNLPDSFTMVIVED